MTITIIIYPDSLREPRHTLKNSETLLSPKPSVVGITNYLNTIPSGEGHFLYFLGGTLICFVEGRETSLSLLS